MNTEYSVKKSNDSAASLSMEYFQSTSLVNGEKEFRNRFMKKVFNYCDSQESYECEKRNRHTTRDDKYKLMHENTRNFASGFDLKGSNVLPSNDVNSFQNEFMKKRNYSTWKGFDGHAYNNLTSRDSGSNLTNGHHHLDISPTNDKFSDMRRLYSERPEMTQTSSFREDLRSSRSNHVKQGYPYMMQVNSSVLHISVDKHHYIKVHFPYCI